MRKTSLLAFILALSAGSAGAQSDDHAREQRFRAGERPGLTGLVPADWKLEPLDPNWKGARFTSPDGHSPGSRSTPLPLIGTRSSCT